MSENLGEKPTVNRSNDQKNPWEDLKVRTFQVAPGTTKEAEFKRLTGEDWPGKKFIAETSGADNFDGYDYPIETWTIRERTKEEVDRLDGMRFQVAPGTTKEAEFKRLTGEDWPGEKYMADTYGVDDDGYDYPIETWIIHKRITEKGSPKTASQNKPDTQGTAHQKHDEHAKQPDQQESYYERMTRKISENKGLTEEHKKNLEDLLNRKFKDKSPEKEPTQSNKTEAEKQKELEIAKQKELELAKKKELEKYKKMTEEERAAKIIELSAGKDEIEARLSEIERQKKLSDEYAKLAEAEAKIAEINQKLGHPNEEDLKPLVAIKADFTNDKKDLAHDLAERNLNDELSNTKGLKGYIKRLWKGTLFKKFFEKKYTREFTEGDRVVRIDGEEFNINELMERRKDGAIARFIMSVTEGSEQFIHEKAGEKRTEADEELTERIRSIIEKFATAQNVSPAERKRKLSDELGRLRDEYRGGGRQADQSIFDNYELVAEQAFERVSHGMAIEDVLEGFKVYNAKVRDGARTEVHRSAIDKIVNWAESSFVGQYIPAEAMAAACSITAVLTQTGAWAVGGITGGILASSLVSGLKEHNRIAEDRTRKLRDVAEGMSYEREGRTVNERTAKYEARIGGTIYDLKSANELIKNIVDAINQEGEGRDEAILRAIAEARVRIDFSDSENKDLIVYTSAEKRGEERLRLDIATIRAEKALSDADKERLELMKTQITKEIADDVKELDQDFNTMRAYMALKKADKTLLLGMTGIAFGPETARTGLGGPADSIVEGEGATQDNREATEGSSETDSSPNSDSTSNEETAEEETADEETAEEEPTEEEPAEEEPTTENETSEEDDKNQKLEFSNHTKAELEQFSNEMLNRIEQNKEAIGGQKGIEFLTDTTKLSVDSQRRYAEWWGSLNDDQKRAVVELVRTINSSDMKNDLEWGRVFRVWLAANARI